MHSWQDSQLKWKLRSRSFPFFLFHPLPAQKRSLPLHLLHTIRVSVGFYLTPSSWLSSRLRNSHIFFSSWKDAIAWVSVFFFLLVLASSLTSLLRWLKSHAVIKLWVSDIRSFPCCSSNFADVLSCSLLCWGAYKSNISFWVTTAKLELIPVHVVLFYTHLLCFIFITTVCHFLFYHSDT